jgi:hypothetical protein
MKIGLFAAGAAFLSSCWTVRLLEVFLVATVVTSAYFRCATLFGSRRRCVRFGMERHLLFLIAAFFILVCGLRHARDGTVVAAFQIRFLFSFSGSLREV